MELICQPLKVILHNGGDRRGRQVCKPKFQHTGPQKELATVATDVTQLLQSQQKPACSRAREACFPRNIRQG
jgi:hypothetical protein